ncbi:MAG TPA: YciI family protein [Gammaproteobacteria bacterium]
MPWVIMSEDNPEQPELRQDHALMEDHWQYELSIKDRILCAGSLRTDDGKTPVGGLLILDVETREEAERLFAADPATEAGLRVNVVFKRWNRAIFDGRVRD